MLSFTQTIFKILILLYPVLFCLIFTGKTWADEGGEIGVVTASRLNVRKLPGLNEPITQILKNGARVKIITHQEGWLQIYFDEQVGYIRNRKQYVRITGPVEKLKKEQDKPEQKQVSPETITQKIKSHEEEVMVFSEREISIINGLNELDLALNEVNQRVSGLKAELAELDAIIQEIENESAGLMNAIQLEEEYISKRLVALYKLHLIGKIHVLASADTMYDTLHRKFAMERILQYDAFMLKNHMEKKERLATLIEDLKQRKEKKILVKANFERQKKIMNHRRGKRKKLLGDIQAKKSLSLAAIESLKQAAEALDQAIMSMHVEPQEPQNTPIEAFTSHKGLLEMPVKGKIISSFGSYKNKRFNVINFNSGIEIEADRGEPIRAVLGGVVLYSGWFKSYGNMIIIDHGGHYYTVYAHAQELFKIKGDPVEKSEVIATVGDTASMSGSNLYFEVRHYGKSMNPLKWLNKG